MSHRDTQEFQREAQAIGATHVLVVCDTFSYEDYPVFVLPGQDVEQRVREIHGKDMQQIHEVIALEPSVAPVAYTEGQGSPSAPPASAEPVPLTREELARIRAAAQAEQRDGGHVCLSPALCQALLDRLGVLEGVATAAQSLWDAEACECHPGSEYAQPCRGCGALEINTAWMRLIDALEAAGTLCAALGREEASRE